MSSKEHSIRLKIAKSKSLLSEVDVLMLHKFYITAINRMYYSCYHATKTLLLTKNLIPKTHSGVVTILHKEFVQNGFFDFSHASFFSRLMQERIEDDYNDFLILSDEEVSDFIEPSKSYVNYVEQLIENYLNLK